MSRARRRRIAHRGLLRAIQRRSRFCWYRDGVDITPRVGQPFFVSTFQLMQADVSPHAANRILAGTA